MILVAIAINFDNRTTTLSSVKLKFHRSSVPHSILVHEDATLKMVPWNLSIKF